MVRMKALTLWQPWASLVAEGMKRIETRSWPAPPMLIGERLAIHAAARVPTPGRGPMFVGGFHVAQGGTWLHGVDIDIRMPFGAVLATARLAACLPMVAGVPPQDEWLEPWDILTLEPWPIRVAWPGYGSAHTVQEYSSQGPFGDFAVGRWAWLLEDVVPFRAPVPARGGQRIWNWTVASVLADGMQPR